MAQDGHIQLEETIAALTHMLAPKTWVCMFGISIACEFVPGDIFDLS